MAQTRAPQLSYLLNNLRNSNQYDYDIQLFSQIRGQLPSTGVDTVMYNLIDYYSSPNIINTSYIPDLKNTLLKAWDDYSYLTVIQTVYTQHGPEQIGQLNKLHQFISSGNGASILSDDDRNRLLSLTQPYQYKPGPNDAVNYAQVQAAYHEALNTLNQIFPAAAGFTQTIQQTVPRNTLNISRQLAGGDMTELRNFMQPSTNPPDITRVPTFDIDDDVFKARKGTRVTKNDNQNPLDGLFQPSSNAIPLKRWSENYSPSKHEAKNPVIYSVETLPELLSLTQPITVPHLKTPETDKLVQFALTMNNELKFSKAGFTRDVPSHHQLIGANWFDAKCLAAGALYFNDKGEITRINHYCQDLISTFDSLQHALPALAQAGFKFAPTLNIIQLNDRNGHEKDNRVDGEQLNRLFAAQSDSRPTRKM